MPDRITKKQRSHVMRSIKSKKTGPELTMLEFLEKLGCKESDFETNCADLPGTPDFASRKYKVAIFVNGCFWHRHHSNTADCAELACNLCTHPSTNKAYWDAKFARNVEHDRETAEALTALKFRVLTVWECDILRREAVVMETLRESLPEMIPVKVSPYFHRTAKRRLATDKPGAGEPVAKRRLRLGRI